MYFLIFVCVLNSVKFDFNGFTSVLLSVTVKCH